MSISLFRPTIKRKEMESVLNCLVSEDIGAGVLSSELALVLSKYIGMKGGICFSSYYSAIERTIHACGLEKGDAVIVSALTPSIYYNVLTSAGLSIQLADVDRETGTVDIESIQKLTDMDPRLIIIHHTLGFISDTESIAQFEIPGIEDVSHALGGRSTDSSCGRMGRFTIMALNPENIVTAGGGAAVLANGNKYLSVLKQAVNIYDSIMPDINAAIGLTQMKHIDSFISARKNIAQIFSQAAMKSTHRPFVQRDDQDSVCFTFPLLIKTGMKEVQRYTLKNNIETRMAFADSCLRQFMEDDIGGSSCPVGRELINRCLLFPLYPTLRKKDIEAISRTISTLP